MITNREKAYAKYLIHNESYDAREAIAESSDKDGDLITGACDYLVLTDEEATERCEESILETLWAFNKSFLDCHSEAISEMTDKEWMPIQNLFESANKIVLKLIDDLPGFMDDAINADGRGRFLSGYDGNENEEYVNGTDYYIYRLN